MTFDNLYSDAAPPRVLLRGIVGSPPGLLSRHSFVLQAADGRGLLVRVPTDQKLPLLEQSIQLTGTLRFDDQNILYLQFSSQDRWKPTATSSSHATTSARSLDLNAPSFEDAWSYIDVQGKILEVKTTSFLIETDTSEITVIIRPPVRYRAKRLTPGDEVHVKGLLDLSSVETKLLVRAAEDITLLHPAETSSSLTSDGSSYPTLPDWLPLTSAAGAIVITEGAKHFHRRRKENNLKQKLAHLTQPKEGV